MDNNTFFSSKNKDLLYNICRDQIVKDSNYNIDDNKKYYRTFGEIMKIVHKHAENKDNLTELNKAVLGKTIPYLTKEIEKKNLTNDPLLPKNVLRDQKLKGGDDLLKKQNQISFRGKSTNANYESVNKGYEKLMADRKNIYSKNENSKPEDYKIDNMSLTNVAENLNQEVSNMNTYDSTNDNIDPMELYQKYNDERENQDNEYAKIQQDRNKFEDQNKNNNQFIDNMLEENKNKIKKEEKKFFDNKIPFEETKTENLSVKINDQMSRANLGDLKGQLDYHLDFYEKNKDKINLPTANDLEAAQNNNIFQNNALFDEFKKSLFEKRKYIERENLITINSGDRDWFNSSETRFNFQVKFNPSVTGDDLDGTKYYGSSNCSLPREFKNITSFEMLRVLVPIENIIVPYDNRIFIDFKSLPYLVLKIEEIEGLYTGSNTKLDKSFAHLVWDKDNTSEVLINGNDNSGSNYSNRFTRQFKRGVCLMAAIGLEKKTFYPSPLSTLNKLTLNLMTPKGVNINNHPDVLQVKKINLLDLSTKSSASSNSIVTNFNGNGNLTLTGAATGSYRNLGTAQQITITSVADTSTLTYTITGTDSQGNTITEQISGPTAGNTVTSVNYYSTITTINSGGATNGNVNVGNTGIPNIEISRSGSFPNDASNLVLQINTFTYFNNRVFKIGDNIKIKGFELKNGVTETFDIENFLNREEGHYIINLEKELNIVNTSSNEGYINNMYISVPGNIDFTDENFPTIMNNQLNNLNTETEIFDDTDSSDNTINCKLINQSLQSNYLFKIITREDDFTNVMTPSNI